jgi:hypothetical protein
MSVESSHSNTQPRRRLVGVATALAALAATGVVATAHVHQPSTSGHHSSVVATPRSPKGVVGILPVD